MLKNCKNSENLEKLEDLEFSLHDVIINLLAEDSINESLLKQLNDEIVSYVKWRQANEVND